VRICLLLLFAAGTVLADEREIQKALIQRDQQSAEFAARSPEARRSLENLHSDQLRDAGRAPLPYERQQMARERMVLPPIDQPASRSVSDTDLSKPLPLPGSGGTPGIAVPIAAPGVGG